MRIIAHRGCGTLEEENTLKAVRKAMEMKVDEIEVDAQLTKDGKLAVFHDSTTDRISDKATAVKDLTLKELRELKKGIPTLQEVMNLIDGKTRLVIDLKSNSPDELVKALGGYRNAVVISKSAEALRRIKELDSSIETSSLVSDKGIDPIRHAAESRSNGLHIGSYCVTKKIVETAKKKGLPVAVGNYNTEQEIKAAMKLGADALTTDRPDIAIRMLRK